MKKRALLLFTVGMGIELCLKEQLSEMARFSEKLIDDIGNVLPKSDRKM
ncbi:MAG: hypothetical protein ACE5K3_03970 [bacterium]